MLTETFPYPDTLGQFRQFGDFGPAYKFIRAIRPIENNDWLVLVVVAKTGEEVEYKYSELQQDPISH